MPELPEVQCVVQSLQRLVGLKFSKVEVLTEQLREKVQVDLHDKLEGREIVAVRRFGKYILFEFDHGVLIGHLGMTGKFVINVKSPKHDHIVFHLNDGTVMRYNDVRKFGFVTYEPDGIAGNKYFQNMGVEPLSSSFNGKWLYGEMQNSNMTAKQFLLDQKHVSGLGNIYVNEVLYSTGIHPEQPVRAIGPELADDLSKEIVLMLKDSISKGGSSFSDYRDADDKKGSYQEYFRVYKRTQDRRGNVVVKISQNGRSSFYCPDIQKIFLKSA